MFGVFQSLDMDCLDFWGGRALSRSQRWATTKSRWKQPPVQFWGWTFAIPNIASNLSLGPKSQGTLRTKHCCCKDLQNKFTGFLCLSDREVERQDCCGSFSWRVQRMGRKASGSLAMVNVIRSRESVAGESWGFVQAEAPTASPWTSLRTSLRSSFSSPTWARHRRRRVDGDASCSVATRASDFKAWRKYLLDSS